MTERIYIQIDDTELTALIGKLDASMTRIEKMDIDTMKLDVSTKAGLTQLDESMTRKKKLDIDTMKLDTELTALTGKLDASMTRIKKMDVDTFKLDTSTKAILTQLPLLREANMLAMRVKAMSTAMEAQGLLGALGPAAAALLLIQVVLTMLDRLQRMQDQIIRDRGAHEDMVRDGLDLTHDEWEMLSREQTGWVTDWEAAVEKSKGDFFAAAEDYMRALYVRYTVSPSEPAIMSWDIGDENLP